ncbi:MAG: hypothetical protein LN566_04985 [Rickettsia endosymbiont of Stiretrus anchorago]|nr:hypothetical protein [Rickettsia endosymbiont of Stiretrus anchorago]
MSKKPNNKDDDFLSPEELAFAEEYDKHHDNTVVDTNDDAQAWAKKLLGESNKSLSN